MQLISAWISLLGCCHTQLKKHFPPSTLNLPFFSFKLYCILFFHHIERDIIQATCLIQCLIHFGLSEKLGTIINRVQVYSSIVNFDCIQSGVHFCLTSTLGLDRSILRCLLHDDSEVTHLMSGHRQTSSRYLGRPPSEANVATGVSK